MSDETKGASRRDFLRLSAMAAPAAAVTVVTGAEAGAAEPEQGSGLRKTAHVLKYLETARF